MTLPHGGGLALVATLTLTEARVRLGLTALLCSFVAVAPRAVRAQAADSSAAGDGARPVCFGISFDRGCGVMFQYEVGVRSGRGRMPRGRGVPYPGYRPPGVESLGGDVYLAGGLMVSRGASSALGLVFEQASYNTAHSLGVRYARRLQGRSRIDVTAGLVNYDYVAWIADGDFSRVQVVGAYGETALHGNNWLTATLRVDGFPSRKKVTGGSRVMVGARLERGPAVGATVLVVALAAIALGSLDCGAC